MKEKLPTGSGDHVTDDGSSGDRLFSNGRLGRHGSTSETI